ncbi:Ser/Thr protein kinase RdoA (MazF antagonist) [Rhodovulum iodosum]|uniref:Ser/Thr protein kinase RdoA (MazF antagonist) n=1 Tax=Rhodovulum iodosum TaxID=68291 RepID=A0ABV3XXF4_9RHOB|nr:phosphotransferase [Rhodovulum robiginosum]RSK40208.1 homoserine kinase [Rhodovulum robiginosum]
MTPQEALAAAREAATHWPGCDAPVLISHRENAVFEVALPEARRGALRVHRRGYQTEDAIRSELWWLEALAEAGLAVPRPERAADGALLARNADGRIASLIGWVEGRPVGAGGVPLEGTPESQMRLYASVGHAVAAMHVAADRLRLPADFHRPHWDIEGLLGTTPFWGRFWEHPAASGAEAALLAEARDFARARLSDYAAGGADQGLIHADLLRENILFDGHHARLIDFDDCGFGFRLYDLGTALSQNLEEPALDAIATGLVEGYATLRPLTRDDHAILPVFVMLRTLASVGWTIPRRASDDPQVRAYLNRALRTAHAVMAGQPLFHIG